MPNGIRIDSWSGSINYQRSQLQLRKDPDPAIIDAGCADDAAAVKVSFGALFFYICVL